jgi:hypothetical protein
MRARLSSQDTSVLRLGHEVAHEMPSVGDKAMSRTFRPSRPELFMSVVLALTACHSSLTPSSKNAGDSDTLASTGEFSFFAVSLKFIKSKAPCSGADSKTCLGGLGGDLRNGKSNGIDGADSLCEEAANLASPGDKHLWRAFLSAGNYNGGVLNAIDRIGSGPWYSAPPKYQGKSSYTSEGLLIAQDRAGLLHTRPDGDATTIVYNGINQSVGAGNAQSWPLSQCLLNEYGDCTQADGDDHDTLTGSKNDGTYAGSMSGTCDDWTNSTKGYGMPAYGHTWPRQLNATDSAAHWINIGEAMMACGQIINVTSTNYAGVAGGPGGAGGVDGGMGPGGGGGWGPDDGGAGPGGVRPGFMGDGGMGPGGGDPFGPGDGGTMPLPWTIDGAASGGNMGAGSEDTTYAGGVGSGGGYGGFYCFAYITGAE